jgi:hypothetical protein
MRSLVRRVTLVLILSAVFVPGLAQAGPRVSADVPIAEAFAFLWDALFGWVKNGAEVDPDGALRPGALSDNGAELDPDGSTAPSDNGAELDPNGRT